MKLADYYIYNYQLLFMKKILLVDYWLQDFYTMVSLSAAKIEALIVETDYEKERVLNDYPNLEVYTCKEIIDWTNTFVSKDEIDNNTSTQLKVERGITRWLVAPSALIMSKYYSSLAFWLWLFKEHEFDVVFICDTVEHGNPTDSIPIDLAKSYSIKVFMVECNYLRNGVNLCAIKDCNADKYISIDSLDCGIKLIDVEDLLFNTSHNSLPYYPESKINNKVIRACAKIFLNIYCKYAAIIHHMHNEKIEKFSDKRKIVDFCIKQHTALKYSYCKLFDKNNRLLFTLGMPFIPTRKEYSRCKKDLKKLNKYYSKHATNVIPSGAKAVIYALHFEPEAQIMNRTSYNSQIYNLMMLSKSLPEGWTIYVKEHPDTFRISKSYNYYMAKSMYNYKNERYYAEILAIPNVKLLNWRMRGDELLSKYNIQIKAVATINGTISFEAIKSNIPLILFDPASTVCGNIEEVFSIRCYEDIVNMFNAINCEGFSQKYTNAWHTLSRFLLLHGNGKYPVPSEIYSSILENLCDNN